jgi:hypothetical protein
MLNNAIRQVAGSARFHAKQVALPGLLIALSACAAGETAQQPRDSRSRDAATDISGDANGLDGSTDSPARNDQKADATRRDLGIDGIASDGPGSDGPLLDGSKRDGLRLDAPGDGPAATPDLAADGPIFRPDISFPFDVLRPDIGSTQANIGDPCRGPSDCRGGTSCILSIGGKGLCTRRDCTVDDPRTDSINEDSCPDPWRNMCTKVRVVGGSVNYCLKRCTPRTNGNDCPTGFACDVREPNNIDQAVCGDTACSANSDCPVYTDVPCNGSTGAGCGSNESCRDSNGQGVYRCAKHGYCNQQSGLCEGHDQGQFAVPIGAPCTTDVDCGNGMYCIPETGTGATTRFRGGYCTIRSCVFGATIPAYACPAGSSCNKVYPSGLCQRNCSIGDANSCRNRSGDKLGDYECYAWNRLELTGGHQIADAPVCDVPQNCDFFFGGCPSLGLLPNSTNMSCRDKQNQTLTNQQDAAGFCLDNTASGPL